MSSLPLEDSTGDRSNEIEINWPINDRSNTPLTPTERGLELRRQQFEEHDGIIVFLDALGVKGIWKSKPKEVLERWDKVYYAFSEQLKFQPGIDLFAFSDTLIISAAGSRAYLENRLGFIELLSGLIIPSFTRSILYKIFLRGVMSMGRYYRSSRILIGPAVDDAAACYEKSNWIGISLTPETSKVLDNNQNVNSDILVNYPVPFKNFNANSWAINWTKYASEQSLYIECKSILSEEFQKHKGEQNIQNKYANTLRFCEYLVQ